MIPQPGQRVKCIFRNGVVAEGLVEEWFNNTAKLRSLDDQSILIITNPTADIMLIKIMLDNHPNLSDNTLPTITESIEQAQSNKSSETLVVDPYNPDYTKSLVDLRKELAEQSRRIIAEKLKEHRPTIGGGKVKYEYPGSNKKSST